MLKKKLKKNLLNLADEDMEVGRRHSYMRGSRRFYTECCNQE